MLSRIDGFLQRNESQGVVLDARVTVNATEAIRLSVVSQLLGYTELYKVAPTPRVRQDITDRADYLIERFDQVRSGSVFDGMFGYALLEAYVATAERRYLDYGGRVAIELEELSTGERILNGGLMGAMALARYHQLTGDPAALEFVDDVMASLPAYQHRNGSFPHWCSCSTDIHYTDWMTTELILIARIAPRPDIAPLLGRMREFIAARIDSEGVTHYDEPCDDGPGCVIPYYSIASGCAIDYDTRAWTNELGYSALLFDGADSASYAKVMRFMGSLEHGGTFADKWDFWGPESDPYYVWTAADTSVINTSLLFWSLASVLSGRGPQVGCGGPGAIVPLPRTAPDLPRALPHRDRVDQLLATGARPDAYCDASQLIPGAEPAMGRPGAGGSVASLSALASQGGAAVAPPRLGVRVGPAYPGAVAIDFALPDAGATRIDVFDAAGRKVSRVLDAPLPAGTHTAQWNGEDALGRSCPSGLYFVALRHGGELRVGRVSRLR